MPEIRPRETAIEAVRFDPQDEIVALYAVPRKVRDGLGRVTDQDVETGGAKIHVCKAGEPDFFLRKGQYARIKRGQADWHVGKHNAGAIDHVLDLKILTLEELDALKKGGALDTQLTARQELVNKLIDSGLIKTADEAEGVTDADLNEMLDGK